MLEFDLQLFSGEKTEQPTPRRRQKARSKGQVVRSQEVTGAVVLLAVAVAVRALGPGIAAQLTGLVEYFLSVPSQQLDEVTVMELFGLVCMFLVRTSAPVLLIASLAGAVANLGQVGFMFSLQRLAPDPSRINPLSGLKRLFSRRVVVDLCKSVAKVGLLGAIGVWTLWGEVEKFPGMLELPLPQVIQFVGGLLWTLTLRAGIAIALIAVFDYFFQRQEHEQNLKMSKQELKQEHRETEGDPLVQARIRQKQQQMARQRMMVAVRTADVVVTNPVHFAVALKYKAEAMAAPRVVAKGQGLVAGRIREIAQEHGVPIVPDPPLARALYNTTDIGDSIPEQMYQAVAEVLAMVYRAGRRVR